MAKINEDVKIEITINHLTYISLDKGIVCFEPNKLASAITPLTQLLQYLIAVQNASLNQ